MKFKLIFFGIFLFFISCQTEKKQSPISITQTVKEFNYVGKNAFVAKTVNVLGGIEINFKRNKELFSFKVIHPNVSTYNDGIIVGNKYVQYSSIGIEDNIDYKNLNNDIQIQYLKGYAKFQSEYYSVDQKLAIGKVKEEVIFLNNKPHLFWYFDMPKGNKPAIQQLYISTICFDNVLTLNSPLMENIHTFEGNKSLLLTIIKTLK